MADVCGQEVFVNGGVTISFSTGPLLKQIAMADTRKFNFRVQIETIFFNLFKIENQFHSPARLLMSYTF